MNRLLNLSLWALGIMTPAIGLLVALSPFMEGRPDPLAVLLFGYAGTALGVAVIFALDTFVERLGL